MNPADVDPDDEDLDACLAAWDEALAAGRLPEPPPASTPPDRLGRLRGLQTLLIRLDRDRRGEPAPEDELPFERTRAGLRLGRFRIVGELGRGGWGIVFLAHDPHLRRDVALKVPRPETLVAPALRRRFLREAQAAAGLDHPHIVSVYEAGEIGPIWYIASAYCEGTTLAEWLRHQSDPVPVRQAAELVALLAGAVHYTHGRGIVHRDLKPANVLLQIADCRSQLADCNSSTCNLQSAIPRITDFGLAKLQEQVGDDTRTGTILGTPAYMAPEQAQGRVADIGPATDIYALGAILYEVLTGRPPFSGSTCPELVRQIALDEPAAIRRLRPDVPADLEAVCLKCLAKSPGQRYASAADLGDDLRRFLAGEPTRARPAGPLRRLGKWARRRPAVAALLVVSVTAALALLAGLTGHVVRVNVYNVELAAALAREQGQRQRAEEQQQLARRRAYAAEIKLAGNLGDNGHPGLMGEVLQTLRPKPGEPDLRGFEWYHLRWRGRGLVYLRGHHSAVSAVAFSPDRRRCASGGDRGTVIVWDTATGVAQTELEGLSLAVQSLAFSSDGTRVAAAAHLPGRRQLQVWDLGTGRRLARRADSGLWAGPVAFMPDGKTLAIGCAGDAMDSGAILLWEPDSGRERFLRSEWGVLTAPTLSPDGTSLATAVHAREQNPCSLELWDASSGRTRARLGAVPAYIEALVFSPDGKLLASLDNNTVRIWDVAASRERLTLPLGQRCRTLAFSPDGRTLATVTEFLPRRGAVRLWDVSSGSERGRPYQPEDELPVSLAFAPDGRTLALGCLDHLVRLWQPGAEPEAVRLPGHLFGAWSVAFAPDGRTLASAGDDLTVQLWDPATRRSRASLWGHLAMVSCVVYAPDGRLLASGSYDHTVRLWDPISGQLQATLTGHTNDVRCLAFAPDGQTLASAGKDRAIRIWDVRTRQVRLTIRGHQDYIRSLAFAPDCRTLASASQDGTVCLWDPADGEKLLQLHHATEVWAVAFSPDGKTLATGGKAGLLRLWERATGKQFAVLWGHTAGVRSLGFAPDGRTLASGGVDNTVRLWQVATGSELLVLPAQGRGVNAVAFSPDGKALAAAMHDGIVRVWPTAEP